MIGAPPIAGDLGASAPVAESVPLEIRARRTKAPSVSQYRLMLPTITFQEEEKPPVEITPDQYLPILLAGLDGQAAGIGLIYREDGKQVLIDDGKNSFADARNLPPGFKPKNVVGIGAIVSKQLQTGENRISTRIWDVETVARQYLYGQVPGESYKTLPVAYEESGQPHIFME